MTTDQLSNQQIPLAVGASRRCKLGETGGCGRGAHASHGGGPSPGRRRPHRVRQPFGGGGPLSGGDCCTGGDQGEEEKDKGTTLKP